MKRLHGLAFVGVLMSFPAIASEPIQPIQPFAASDEAKVELGKKLYFDPRLSKSGFISCNSCHNLGMGGTDNLPSSIGHHWALGPINAPTVLNSSLNFVQFWDGRAKDLKEQAGGPIANPKEMGFTHELAVDVLESIPGYRTEFEAVFNSDKINIDQVTDAIASFEETLVTPDAPFDRFLKGEEDAISAQAKVGYEHFKTIGCIACHNGEAIGGTSFQKMGLVKPYKTDNPALGLYAVTGNEADRYKFKVPTLRNVELTYPYFHDGAVWTLEEAVTTMADVQLGRKLDAQQVKDIVAFLKSLTGKQPEIALPLLPPSTNETPHPDRS